MDLASFIDTERRAIVAEWEAFARTLIPAARDMTAAALRDHADEILSAIVHDMRSRQTSSEQAEKAKGQHAGHLEEVGQIHAGLRIQYKFKLWQMVAEYRALRASVLRLWGERGTDPKGVVRFNESIDEALTEAVDRFTLTTEHYRDQTLGILGHDLRGPLSAIVTGATLLSELGELHGESASIPARMLTSANRMRRMIDDLLDLTRTRFGDLIPVVPAPMDLYRVCQQVVAEHEGRRPAESLRLSGVGDLRGEWDADRLAQLLSNLVRNAIEHGPPDQPIDVIAEGAGDDVSLAVHNAGLPIPEEVIATIYEPMFRPTQSAHTRQGLGLGLYIARQIALAHGGSLDVTSTDAAGTTFKLRLPRRNARSQSSHATGTLNAPQTL
jgi:signal transduction histidine kinase